MYYAQMSTEPKEIVFQGITKFPNKFSKIGYVSYITTGRQKAIGKYF